MKVLLIVVVVAVGILVAVDFALRTVAENRVADELEKSLKLGGDASVSLGGWPFLYRVATGNFTSVSVTAPSLTRAGVRLVDIRANLEDVDFSISDALSGDVGSATVRTGAGRAGLTAGGLNAALDRAGIDVDAEITGGRVLVSSRRFDGVEARPSIRGGSLVLRLRPGIRPIEIELPRIASGFSYGSVDVRGSRAVLGFRLRNATLVAP